MNTLYTFSNIMYYCKDMINNLKPKGYEINLPTMTSDLGLTRVFVDMYSPFEHKLLRIRLVDVVYDGHIGYILEVRKIENYEPLDMFQTIHSDCMPLVTSTCFLKIETGKYRDQYVVADNPSQALDFINKHRL